MRSEETRRVGKGKNNMFGPKWPNSLNEISKPVRNVSYELVPRLSRSLALNPKINYLFHSHSDPATSRPQIQHFRTFPSL